jgi:hypothetical protein
LSDETLDLLSVDRTDILSSETVWFVDLVVFPLPRDLLRWEKYDRGIWMVDIRLLSRFIHENCVDR